MNRRRGEAGAAGAGSEHKAAPLDLAGRVALRPPEAARALGVSERSFRDLLPEVPHVRRGGLVLIPVASLNRWLEEQARAGKVRTDRVAAEILAAMRA